MAFHSTPDIIVKWLIVCDDVIYQGSQNGCSGYFGVGISVIGWSCDL